MSKSEKDLYEPVKRELVEKFSVSGKIHLEVSADGKMKVSEAELDPDYAYRIMEVLQGEESGTIWFSKLRKRGRFSNSILKKQLDILVPLGYLNKIGRSHEWGKNRFVPRTYYAMTPKGESWLLLEKQKLEEQTKTVSTLAKDIRQMPKEEVSEFYDDLRKEFDHWFNRIDEGEACGALSFHTRLPIRTSRYEGWITIQWWLTREERERRERERREVSAKENVETLVFKEEANPEEQPRQDDNRPFFPTSDQIEEVREKLFGYRRDEKGRTVKRRRVQVGGGG